MFKVLRAFILGSGRKHEEGEVHDMDHLTPEEKESLLKDGSIVQHEPGQEAAPEQKQEEKAPEQAEEKAPEEMANESANQENAQGQAPQN